MLHKCIGVKKSEDFQHFYSLLQHYKKLKVLSTTFPIVT